MSKSQDQPVPGGAGPEAGSGPPRLAPEQLHRSVLFVLWAWAFGAFWLQTVTGASLTRFAQQMGLSPFGFGLMAAISFMAALVQPISALFIERHGRRKGLFLATALPHRLLWLAIAGIPWLLPQRWWTHAFLWLVGLAALGAYASSPAWLSWMSDLIPRSIRGRFMSRRVQLGNVVTLLLCLAIGLSLDWAGRRGDRATMAIAGMWLAAAAVMGTADILMHAPVPDPGPTRRPGPRLGVRLLLKPLADRNFRFFLLYIGTLTFATAYIGAYIWLFAFDVLGMSNLKANILLTVAPLAVSIFLYRPWGRVMDRIGYRPVMLIGGGFIIIGPSLWPFVSGPFWWVPYIVVLAIMVGWAAIEVANTNFLMALSESRRHPGAEGVAYPVLYGLVVATSGIASGLAAGAIAAWLGKDWQRTLFGFKITYHAVLLFLSSALRLLAVLCLIPIREPKALGTRQALRYVTEHTFANLHHAFLLPVRWFGRAAQYSYKIGPQARPTRPNR